MKIGVISDTHIPERAPGLPEKLLRDLKAMDMIIHAGDLADLSVLTSLKKICPDVRGVAGNMDPSEVCVQLPDKLVFKAGKFTIGVAHGCGAPQRLPEMMRELFKKDKVDLIIFGHSHYPVILSESAPILFNPGSPTDTIFAPYRSYGVVELNGNINMKIVKL